MFSRVFCLKQTNPVSKISKQAVWWSPKFLLAEMLHEIWYFVITNSTQCSLVRLASMLYARNACLLVAGWRTV